MSNAEKMVGEDLIRAILGNAAQGYFSKDHGDQLRAILDQPAQQGQRNPIPLPEGYMLAERSIWTERQVEAATACITRLKGVPGMRDRDLAMAAIDAAQCKAPEVTLADLLPAQQGQGEPVGYQIRSKTDRPGSQWKPWRECCDTERALHGHEVGRFNQFGIMREIRPVFASAADPAEVGRLRANAGQHKLAMDAASGEVEALRAQLAQAHALLARILGKRDPCPARYWFEEIEKVLSASAEPSTPVEINETVCKGAWELGTACGKCSRCKAGAALEPVKLDLIQRLRGVGTNQLNHIANGLCPDQIEGYDSRDESCPACKVLMQADALIGKQ
ncbi:hypothetical protein G7007_16725 [Pseudomonas entomophila]|uniref:hypothetical protein n=1 Tax=Pseudomonas entomophila TaxID=312306 RepID=UPI0015E37B0E|nr:hypothetical protein [Pseudomonas entomophila]MBA1194481.1 hypothetical protein [Pseudomonas entomophila]